MNNSNKNLNNQNLEQYHHHYQHLNSNQESLSEDECLSLNETNNSINTEHLSNKINNSNLNIQKNNYFKIWKQFAFNNQDSPISKNSFLSKDNNESDQSSKTFLNKNLLGLDNPNSSNFFNQLSNKLCLKTNSCVNESLSNSTFLTSSIQLSLSSIVSSSLSTHNHDNSNNNLILKTQDTDLIQPILTSAYQNTNININNHSYFYSNQNESLNQEKIRTLDLNYSKHLFD